MNNNTHGQSGTGDVQNNGNPPDQNRHASSDKDSESHTSQDSYGSLISIDQLTLMFSLTNIGVEPNNGNAPDQNLYYPNEGESASHGSQNSYGTLISGSDGESFLVTSLDSDKTLASSEDLMLADQLTAILSSVNIPNTQTGDVIHVDPRYGNLIFRILCGEKRSDIWPIYKLKRIHRYHYYKGVAKNLSPSKGRYPTVYPPIHSGDRPSEWLFRLRCVKERVERQLPGDASS